MVNVSLSWDRLSQGLWNLFLHGTLSAECFHCLLQKAFICVVICHASPSTVLKSSLGSSDQLEAHRVKNFQRESSWIHNEYRKCILGRLNEDKEQVNEYYWHLGRKENVTAMKSFGHRTIRTYKLKVHLHIYFREAKLEVTCGAFDEIWEPEV